MTPAGSDVVVIDNGLTALTVIETGAVALRATGVVESVTRRVKSEVPAARGYPKMTPLVTFRVRPGGSLPDDTDHRYGGFPPVAPRVVEYDWSAIPPGSRVVVIDRATSAPTLRRGSR